MSLKTYFTLYTDSNNSLESFETNGSKPHAFIQWFVLLLGIVIQPFFTSYKETGDFAWNYDWKFLLFAIIVAFVAFPGIYRKAFDSDQPKWIQVIPIFTAGLGWQTLVDAAINGGKDSNTVKDAVETAIQYGNNVVEFFVWIV